MLSFTTARRRLLAGAIALGAVPVLLVAAQPLSASGSGSSAQTLTFHGRDGTFRFFDVAPKGEHPSTGDHFILTEHLFKGGDRIGTLHATCTVTRKVARPGRTPLLCEGVYRLPGGRLAGTALLRANSDTNHVAITGGTGKYAGAGGEAVEVFDQNGRSTVTVTLK